MEIQFIESVMRNLIHLLLLVLLVACGNSEAKRETNKQVVQAKVENALKFINDYVKNPNNTPGGVVDWVNSNSLASKSFKSQVKFLIENGFKQDPELGLGFDPILDAQDNPESFELESIAADTNFLIVKGKDWPAFKLTMKVVEVDGIWLVDGCGVINVPDSLKSVR